jgi:hypothetical protein
VRIGEFRVELDGRAIFRHRRFEPVLIIQGRSKAIVELCDRRIESDSPAICGNRVVELPLALKYQPDVSVRARMSRVRHFCVVPRTCQHGSRCAFR